MIVKDLNTLGYRQVVFRCDNEPAILSLLRVEKLAWSGDVVQETSAEHDPESNGAAESSQDWTRQESLHEERTTLTWERKWLRGA